MAVDVDVELQTGQTTTMDHHINNNDSQLMKTADNRALASEAPKTPRKQSSRAKKSSSESSSRHRSSSESRQPKTPKTPSHKKKSSHAHRRQPSSSSHRDNSDLKGSSHHSTASSKSKSRSRSSSISSRSNKNGVNNVVNESLSKEHPLQNHVLRVPHQLGNIDPLGSNHNDDNSNSNRQDRDVDESLRYEALLCMSPATTATTHTFATESFLTMQSSQQTATTNSSHRFVVVPSSQKKRNSHNAVLVGDPETILGHLLEAVKETSSSEQESQQLASQLQQAMSQLIASSGTAVASNNGRNDEQNELVNDTETQQLRQALHDTQQQMQQMQQQLAEMQKTQLQLLQFQQTALKEKEEQQKEMTRLKAQLKQMQMMQHNQQQKSFHNSVNLQNQQSWHNSMTINDLCTPSTQQSNLQSQQAPVPTEPISRKNSSSHHGSNHESNNKSLEEQDMLDRLAAYEEWENSQDKLDIGPDGNTEAKRAARKEKMADRKMTKKLQNSGGTNGDFTIETEYEEDESYDVPAAKKPTEDASNQQAPRLKTSTEATGSAYVDVWICGKCNFEHEGSSLQFCGVCGASKPEQSSTTPGQQLKHPTTPQKEDPENDMHTPIKEIRTPIQDSGTSTPLGLTTTIKKLPTPPMKEISTPLKLRRSTSHGSAVPPPTSPVKRSKSASSAESSPASPTTATPKQIKRRGSNRELRASAHTERDMVSMTPGRRRSAYGQTKSSSNINPYGIIATPKRNRPRVPKSSGKGPGSRLTARAPFEDNEPASEPFMMVKCVDPDANSGEAFDMDMLNQQLSTFDSNPKVAAGSLHARSAPKTPKVNKRGNAAAGGRLGALRKTKSALDVSNSDHYDDDNGGGLSTSLHASVTKAANSNLRQAIPRRAKSSATEELRKHQMQQSGGAVGIPPPSPSGNKKNIFGAAVSALHKSPKKAITALKIAGNAVPKSLLMGGGASGAKKGFMLDSDSEDETERDDRDFKAPHTPKRRGSLENRAKASAVSTGKAGWKKWFDGGGKNPVDEDDYEPSVVSVDIDDTARDLEAADDIIEKPAQGTLSPRRRMNKSNSGERPPSRGRRRRDDNGVSPKRSNHGSNSRPRRRSQEAKERPKDDLDRGSSHKPRDWNGRRRRTSIERRNGGPPRNEALAKAVEQIPTDPTFRVRKDIQHQWEKQDNLEQNQKKAEMLKQRVQGLRKGMSTRNIVTASSAALADDAGNRKSSPNVAAPVIEAAAHSDETSEDGCTIYLEKSIGDMSEITTPFVSNYV